MAKTNNRGIKIENFRDNLATPASEQEGVGFCKTGRDHPEIGFWIEEGCGD